VFVIIGFVVVLACVFGGFMLAGGNIMVVARAAPIEMLIICGAALGGFITANGPKVIKETIGGVLGLFKGPKYGKTDYVELLKLLYEILMKIRKEGLMAIEAHVENPSPAPSSRSTRRCWPTTTCSISSPTACA